MSLTGIIDIGTNTVLSLKAELSSAKIEYISDHRWHYRAGKRLDDKGNLSGEYKQGMIKAVGEALRDLADCGQIRIAATEVLRKPLDGPEVASEISEMYGHRIEIIDQQREAQLSFKGATASLIKEEIPVAVIDVGGGSSELAIGLGHNLLHWSGIKIGAVSLSEQVGYEMPVEAYRGTAETMLSQSDFGKLLNPKPQKIIAVGGTAVSLAALDLRAVDFNHGLLDGYHLSDGCIADIITEISALNLDTRRKLMAFDPVRADIIIPGAVIIKAFMTMFAFETIIISVNGLRHGLLLELFTQLNA